MNAEKPFDTLLDAVIAADRARTEALERLGKLDELRRLATPHCGSCYFWMKSRECPRETNIGGRNRGPSMGAMPCQKFQGDRLFKESVRKYEQFRKELSQQPLERKE